MTIATPIAATGEALAALEFSALHIMHAPDLFCVADHDHRFRAVNHAWTRTLGWSAEEMLGRPFLELVHPEDVAATIAAAGRVADGTSVDGFVNRYRCRDGSYRWLEWRSSVNPEDGLVFAVARDVSERRRGEILAAAVEQVSRVGSWEISLDHDELIWSPATYAIHDLDPASHRPRLQDGLSYYPPEAQAQLMAAVERLMTDGTPYVQELAFITARGRRTWVRVTASAEMRDGAVVRCFGTIEDIAEERAARRRERKLSAVATNSPNIIMLADASGAITYVNATFERLTGLTLAQLNDPANPAAVALLRALMAAADPALSPGGRDVAIRAADGARLWLRVGGWPVPEDDARVILAVDITEARRQRARERRAEREARKARAQLEAAVEVLDSGFVLFDRQDRMVLFNRRYLEMYALSAPAITPGARFEDMLRYGLARGQILDAVGREEAWLADRMAAHRSGACEMIQALPGDRWLRIVERRTPGGGIVGLRMDVTELTRNRRRLAAIIDGADVGTWEWDIHSDALIVNPRWAAMLGRAVADIAQADAAGREALIHPDDIAAVNDAMRSHLSGAKPLYEVELRALHANGDWVWVTDRGRIATRTPDGAPLSVSGTRLDISERMRSRKQLEQAVREAEQANAVKGEFLANMSHEIRTPLTSVIGFTKLLRTQPELSAESIGFVEQSIAGCNALLATVNDILDFSKLEAGQISIAPRPTDIVALLNECVGLFALRAADKGLTLRAEGADTLPPHLLLDPDRVRQIALNLLGNAVKFTETGGITLSARHLGDTDTLEISVRDTGPGIEADALARLFRRFSQVDGSNTRKHTGTGLGLAICKGLSEAMQGGIRGESTPGEGSTFTFWLKAPPCGAAPGVSAQIVQSVSLAGLRVLLADDVEINRAFLTAVVQVAGGVTTEVEDGDSLLDVAMRQPFDLILLDQRMPGLDGLEAAAKLRAQPGPNQCAAMILISADITALNGPGLENVDATIAKPVGSRDLLRVIAEVMGLG